MVEIIENLKDIFLFHGLDKKDAEDLTKNVEIEVCDYHRGDLIFTPQSYSPKIGFVFEGECEVRCKTTDGKTILNLIKVGESFGILAALGEKEFPTEIYAKRNSKIGFIRSKDLIRLIEESGTVAMNVIKFLAGRVSFLNRKLNTVTKNSVEKKLASYIYSRYRSENTLSIPFNLKKCSESISAGRASVYRSLENLKSKGYISAENKKINIINLQSLEDFLK